MYLFPDAARMLLLVTAY